MASKKQKPNVQVRLPDDLQEHLQRHAAENFRTLTGEITMRLTKSIAEERAAAPQGGNAGSTA